MGLLNIINGFKKRVEDISKDLEEVKQNSQSAISEEDVIIYFKKIYFNNPNINSIIFTKDFKIIIDKDNTSVERY